ncbi:MAG: hypothetical protein ACYTA3_04500 [Planctomycetota bacterium]
MNPIPPGLISTDVPRSVWSSMAEEFALNRTWWRCSSSTTNSTGSSISRR